MGITTLTTALTSLFILSPLISAQDPSSSSLASAPLATDQPSRVTYQAILQDGKPIRGQISGVAAENGTGVTFNINWYDFPDVATAGPFAYHIHTNPIDSDGNCSSAKGHLMPFNGPPDNFTCNPADPAVCQVGDLSGKHGKIGVESGPSALTNGKLMLIYTDGYVSAIEGSEAFFGNRSIVVHAANGTRLNCASFQRIEGGQGGSSSGSPTGPSSTGGSGGYPSGTSTQPSPSTKTGVNAGETIKISKVCSGLLGVVALMMAAWL